ncbi:C-glycoside deglycosidase beta subunit domain-containing protein [Labrys wisconsinensis]|uniref:C-deglycosylation enzyme beta subunit n=1 Tax=Labrys wisconsinensis TaxID=425677 RepID=A0ABU0J1X0_9HYPH|nr:DUF6379 domain-containing protein [Labrys wisconsinensis]MDQ0468252.1 hypothetical protein [Labrys wisconsinensis]
MPAGSTYCIARGMLRGPIRNVRSADAEGGNYVAFDIGNQFLHPNHPLGWIRRLEIDIDGETVPAVGSFFVLRRQWFPLTHLRTITDVWWHMGETATLNLSRPPIAPGRRVIACRFFVSLFVNTPKIDLDDLWPSLTQNISAELICEG